MKGILRAIYFLIGASLGALAADALSGAEFLSRIVNVDFTQTLPYISLLVVFGVIFGIISLIIIPYIISGISALYKFTVAKIKGTSLMRIVYSVVSLVVALIIAALASIPIYQFKLPNIVINILVVLIYVVFVCLALIIVSSKMQEIDAVLRGGEGRKLKEDKNRTSKKNSVVPKILDTSVIIDGRIFDILKTGFVDGPIIIPEFVLDELRYIADSEDDIKRGRGRRGIDILNKIQKELPIEIIITNKDYPNVHEVDNKLVTLAQEMKGKVVTNDYNLNKIAEFRGVDVLNTNELSNAVKVIVLPGEEMTVHVLKEGKEQNQGIAYTQDGTMIVVENGKNYINRDIHAVVTSVLQTSAGRLIFVKPR